MPESSAAQCRCVNRYTVRTHQKPVDDDVHPTPGCVKDKVLVAVLPGFLQTESSSSFTG